MYKNISRSAEQVRIRIAYGSSMSSKSIAREGITAWRKGLHASNDRNGRKRKTTRTEGEIGARQKKGSEGKSVKQQAENKTLILHETPSRNEFSDGFERAGDVPDIDSKVPLSIAAQMQVCESRVPDRVEILVVK